MNKTSHSASMTNNALVIAYDTFPAVFLTETCDVSDYTECFRSCCGKTADRTLLSRILTDDFLSLESFCASPYITHSVFNIHWRSYRFAVAYKIANGESSGTVLFLLKNEYQKILLIDLLGGRISPTAYLAKSMADTRSPSLNSAILALFSPIEELDGNETSSTIRYLISRFHQSGEFISSKIIYSEMPSSQIPVTDVPSGMLAVSFASLLTVLDSVSQNGIINVTGAVTEASIDLRLSSNISENLNIPPYTDDLLSLSHIAPSCLSHLVVAAYSALDSGMYVKAEYDRKRLSFIIGYRSDTPPLLEFKSRDTEKAIADTVSAVITFLRTLDPTAQSTE